MNGTFASLLVAVVLMESGFTVANPADILSEVVRAQDPTPVDPKRPAWAPEHAADVLVMVQAFYDGTTDLEARFRQDYWNRTYGESTSSSGRLRLKKPGRMVWDYQNAADADYYANGETLWMVEHDTRQVIKTSARGNSEMSAALDFLFGGEEILRDFKVRYADKSRVDRYGDADHYVLELKPRKANKHYRGLVLIVHATTGRVDGFVVYNTDDSVNYFQLTNVRTNVGLADKVFDFNAPAGYVETTE